MSAQEPHQEQLFDPNRYSPVSAEVMLKLPAGNTRAFMVASALGWFKDAEGSPDRIRSGREAAGSLVTPRRLPVILHALQLGQRQWQRYVTDWCGRYVAHRCTPGSVFLFTHSLYLNCPACKAEILADHAPPKPNPERGQGFAASHHDAESVVVRRSERTITTQGGALSRRRAAHYHDAPQARNRHSFQQVSYKGRRRA
jgi:hypothetical protein